ncbi:hypothetical protein C8R43DRAFT_1194502 [Mycena crocata]|nr:hypothetical protein C8R43DRAFT_1194502 [Mycena crocata]
MLVLVLSLAFLTSQVAGEPCKHGLPEGTFVAAGAAGLRNLTEHLTSDPDAKVLRLLLSDSVAPVNASQVDFNATETSCETIGALATQILDRVEGTLTAFSYLSYTCPSVPNFVLERDFSNLTELTLGVNDVWRNQDALFRHKSLTHLHCAGAYGYHNRNPPNVGFVLRQLRNLTHFRVSGPQHDGEVPALDKSPPSIGIGLVDGVAGWIQQTVFNPSLIPTNFTMIIQPGPDPGRFDPECGTTSVAYDSWVDRLADRGDVRLRRIPSREPDEDEEANSDLNRIYPLHRAVDEFTDRSCGGDGEWGGDPRVADYTFHSMTGWVAEKVGEATQPVDVGSLKSSSSTVT